MAPQHTNAMHLCFMVIKNTQQPVCCISIKEWLRWPNIMLIKSKMHVCGLEESHQYWHRSSAAEALRISYSNLDSTTTYLLLGYCSHDPKSDSLACSISLLHQWFSTLFLQKLLCLNHKHFTLHNTINNKSMNIQNMHWNFGKLGLWLGLWRCSRLGGPVGDEVLGGSWRQLWGVEAPERAGVSSRGWGFCKDHVRDWSTLWGCRVL